MAPPTRAPRPTRRKPQFRQVEIHSKSTKAYRFDLDTLPTWNKNLVASVGLGWFGWGGLVGLVGLGWVGLAWRIIPGLVRLFQWFICPFVIVFVFLRIGQRGTPSIHGRINGFINKELLSIHNRVPHDVVSVLRIRCWDVHGT